MKLIYPEHCLRDFTGLENDVSWPSACIQALKVACITQDWSDFPSKARAFA